MNLHARRVALFVTFAVCVLTASRAFAWGDTGHRMIGTLAIETLPDSVPAFLRSQQAATDIGEWAREPDRWRSAGLVHNDMRDPGHFIDVDDTGNIPGGPALNALPPTRTELETMLAKNGTSIAKTGFLPYTIVDGWQQIVKDFAYWRADVAGERLEKDPAKRAWIARDRLRREEQTIMDIGIWAHYVGDGSQPLHVSTHYNGWGDGPNPNGFTTDPIHVPWESPFVRDYVAMDAVKKNMTPYRDCGCAITLETADYLSATRDQVVPFYTLEKAGGLSSKNTALIAFTTARLAAGASELRDLIAAAWAASASGTVGYPVTGVADVEAGRANAYDLLHGTN